jgi:hypothetical protein
LANSNFFFFLSVLALQMYAMLFSYCHMVSLAETGFTHQVIILSRQHSTLHVAMLVFSLGIYNSSK